MAFCQRCKNIVAEADIVPKQIARTDGRQIIETYWEEWCRECTTRVVPLKMMARPSTVTH
jgi:hypothetical protein